MDTWNCIEASLWEDFGEVKVCRECGYPIDFASINTHPDSCSLGHAVRTFAATLKTIEDEVEEKRKIRYQEWELEQIK